MIIDVFQNVKYQKNLIITQYIHTSIFMIKIFYIFPGCFTNLLILFFSPTLCYPIIVMNKPMLDFPIPITPQVPILVFPRVAALRVPAPPWNKWVAPVAVQTLPLAVTQSHIITVCMPTTPLRIITCINTVIRTPFTVVSVAVR